MMVDFILCFLLLFVLFCQFLILFYIAFYFCKWPSWILNMQDKCTVQELWVAERFLVEDHVVL